MNPLNHVEWATQNKYWIMDMKTWNNKLLILCQYNKNLIFNAIEKNPLTDNFFFTCMDENGKMEWFADARSSGAIFGSQFDMDESGNSYVLCSFKENMQLGDKQLKPEGDKNAFLAKFNVQGKLEWVKQLTGGNSFITGIWAHTVCYDSKNQQILVGGEFAGDCKFDDFKINSRKLIFGPKVELSGNEVFLAKYTTDGECTGVKSLITEANLTQIRTDSEGNIFLGGYFKGELSASKAGDLTGISIFGGTQKIKTSVNTNMGLNEVGYIAKFNYQDQIEWVAHCESSSTNRIISFVMDNEDNIFACGFAKVDIGFSGKTTRIPLGQIHGIGDDKNNGDIIILKINRDGNPGWFSIVGGSGEDDAKDICLTNNALKVVGYMSGKVYFDGQYYKIPGNSYNGVILSISNP
jgi:hypothetical protein